LRDDVARTTALEPELLAQHFTQAGMSEAAVEWWGKAGQRSREHSALVEAAEQFTRALSEMEFLPTTPALRRERIKLQVALSQTLGQVRGFSAPETKSALERARLLIEQVEALGEPPVRLFSVLFGFWIANVGQFNGDVMLELATQYLALAAVSWLIVCVLHPSRPVGRHATSPAKASSVPGITHTASPGSSAAAKPRVPVPKSRVASLSPTFAGRERTLWRLKSHISGSPSLEALQPHETLVRLRSSRITQNLTSPRQRVMGEVFHPVEPKLRKVPWSLS
jgi:hypothetical protein